MERISEFMDGEVGDNEVSAQLARLKQDPALRQAWHTYHLIGDAMRGDTAVAPGFMGRFSAALAQEPTVLAPKAPVKRSSLPRIALPLAASFGGVALVAWLAMSTGLITGNATVASNPNPPVTLADAKPDEAAREYITAHQGAVSFVRTVSARDLDKR